jgi:hypothetical protein
MDQRYDTLILRTDSVLVDRLKALAWAVNVPVAVLVRAVLRSYLDESPLAAEALLDFAAAGRPGDKRQRREEVA